MREEGKDRDATLTHALAYYYVTSRDIHFKEISKMKQKKEKNYTTNYFQLPREERERDRDETGGLTKGWM